MLLNKLTTILNGNRTAKSDPEISRLASPPMAIDSLETHPASTQCILELQPSSSSAMFTSFSPMPLPFGGSVSESDVELSTTIDRPGTYDSSDTLHRASMYASRANCIFEENVLDGDDIRAYTHALEDALATERSARRAIQEVDAARAAELESLRKEAEQLKEDLVYAFSFYDRPFPRWDGPAYWDTEADEPLTVKYSRLSELVHSASITLPAKSSARPPAPALSLAPPEGTRTQGEYAAQVRCTLGARAEARSWRARAAFWKRAAREEGRHTETVTPSASALATTQQMEEVHIGAARRARVEEMLQRLKAGELPLRVTRVGHADDGTEGEDLAASVPTVELGVRPPPSVSVVSEGAAEGSVSMNSMQSVPPLPALSSSMVLPAFESTSTARLSAAPSHLHPLDAGNSSFMSTSSGRGVSASASTSTLASVKSLRRHVKVLPSTQITVSDSLNASGALIEPSRFSSTDSSTPSSSPSKASSLRPLPQALVDFGNDSDEDLVLVMHNDFSETSYCATSERPDGLTEAVPRGVKERKARLPAFGLRAIRRFSTNITMGRTPLADTSNTGGRGRGTKGEKGVAKGARLQKLGIGSPGQSS